MVAPPCLPVAPVIKIAFLVSGMVKFAGVISVYVYEVEPKGLLELEEFP